MVEEPAEASAGPAPYWDERVKRWRDPTNGRFVKPPRGASDGAFDVAQLVAKGYEHDQAANAFELCESLKEAVETLEVWAQLDAHERAQDMARLTGKAAAALAGKPDLAGLAGYAAAFVAQAADLKGAPIPALS
jgi:hypothetical protein